MTAVGTDPGHDPLDLTVELVCRVEQYLSRDQVHRVVTGLSRDRTKQRRLARALAADPALLITGQPPAPKAVAELLVALRAAGARAIAAPHCDRCGRPQSGLRRWQSSSFRCATCTAALHWLLHAHFLLAGCLFAYVIAGPDPAPARPGVPVRLVVLGVAIAAHAVISQLMYGGFGINIHAPVDQVQRAAEIMYYGYYGGDIAELLLAVALVATWRPQHTAHRAPDLRRRSADAARPVVP
ncbi:cytochrome c oxidase assembly protein [Streptomyces sp. 8N706]|uniref:cytochrome c oxidase assembly protein n=1 Tax=Streptomyces sp. 8N706 TaxID=3457416 RepID=UPI003FD416F8